jgi:nucleotide-binding universal stress UspA family protein
VEEEIPRHAEVIDESSRALRRRIAPTRSYELWTAACRARCRARAAMHSVDLETVIVPGHAVKVIGDFVRENAIDLLVIGFTGHSRIYDHIWGGTAHNLTGTVRSNVLVVK